MIQASKKLLPKQFRSLCLYCLILLPYASAAEWNVSIQQDEKVEKVTNVAYTVNKLGYTLEIYRDSVNAIRSRFTMTKGLLRLSDKTCPTYQIDRGPPKNRSINDAPCISSNQWAEYIMGYVNNDEIASSLLLALMDGVTITYRFHLASGDYRETKFSLFGSKRAMTIALGENVTVVASAINQ